MTNKSKTFYMLTLQLTKTVTEEKTIPVPCFWKRGRSYYGLIDEDNLYNVLLLDDYYTILNCSPEKNKQVANSFLDDGTELITEAQFFSAYDEARKATELHPLITNSDRYVDMLETVGINQKEI